MATGNFTVTVHGVDDILRKLGSGMVKDETDDLLKETSDLATHTLGPTIPRRTGASAAEMRVELKKDRAEVLVPFEPLGFVDLGTRRGLSARHFMARARTKLASQLPKLITRAEKALERRWNA